MRSTVAQIEVLVISGFSRLANITNNSNQDSLNRKEVSLVLKRLDEIAEKQKVQMEALDAVAYSSRNDNVPIGSARKQVTPPQRPNHLSIATDGNHPLNRQSYSALSDNESEKNSPASSRADYEDDFTSSSNL